jgi:hypothetical protein
MKKSEAFDSSLKKTFDECCDGEVNFRKEIREIVRDLHANIISVNDGVSALNLLLARQQSEATRTARNELMANFEENRENWLKYADKKVAEAQEEFVKCLPEEKEIPPFREDKKTISRDELLMRTAYNQCIADIKSKLNI